MDKRKIIATTGPSSFTKAIIHKMDLAGVDIFRINLSHTKIDELEQKIKQLQRWTSKSICIDTEGAQLRSGMLQKDVFNVTINEKIEFISCDALPTKKSQIPLSVQAPWQILAVGNLLYIDFGSVIVQIIGIKPDGQIVARVIQGGAIGSNKGIGVDRDIKLPTFTEKDVKAFAIANRLGVKTIAPSFTSSGEEVKKLRKFFDYKIKVISKIESNAGLKNLNGICRESDAILIDRGDLSYDVPLEKIVFAQSYILERAKSLSVPVYVATNLMESMVQNPKPTRAEIHDIVGTLQQGASGLVLAIETAVGQYPVKTVEIMSSIINEIDYINSKKSKQNLKYLTSFPPNKVIEPHGGVLIQQYTTNHKAEDFNGMPSIEVGDEILSDIIQIAEGTYSPVNGFMNLEEMESVLENYKLPNGIVWTLPILFQTSGENIQQLPSQGEVIIKWEKDHQNYAVLKIQQIQKLKAMNQVAQKWFGTDNKKHPGVRQFFQAGEYIIAGLPLLIKKPTSSNTPSYELVPRQTRRIFNELGWHNIVGFHTRNVAHRGHEFVQKKALKQSNADAIFISPVVGKKKTGDFTGQIIIQCYEEMIRKGYYNPYGAILGVFNTYSRYSGPREAVFTAICRKNFGCSHFIIGRDHTGVGNYYAPDASQKIFNQVDTGMEILIFDSAYFCEKCGRTTDYCQHPKPYRKSLSGSKIRALLQNNYKIDEYLMRPDIGKILEDFYKKHPGEIIEN